jgi:hypothetical protein
MRRLARLVILSALVCAASDAPADAQSAMPEASRSDDAGTLDEPGPPRPSASVTRFPGSTWVNSGYASPLEAGNLLTTYAAEQGFTLLTHGPHGIIPFAAITIVRDQRGLDWNNRALSHIGVKYARTFFHGIVQAGGGYAYEHRFRSGTSMGQPIGFASYWFGWNRSLRPARARTILSSLPGTSWGAVGNHAPAERHNVSASVYVQQGLTVVTLRDVSVIPFVEGSVSADSAGYSWNNRRMHGEGLKLRLPVGAGVLETAATYKHERRWREGRSADGLTGSVTFWYGWNPSKTPREK